MAAAAFFAPEVTPDTPHQTIVTLTHVRPIRFLPPA
jgi:hypothetical protein